MPPLKLVSYEWKTGPRAGIVVGDRLIDAATATGRADEFSMMALLADWTDAQHRIYAAAGKTEGAVALASVKLLAPIPVPGAIYCAGANYADHAAEMARARNQPPPPDPHTLGLRSWHFIKVARCVTGTGAVVELPPKAKKVDWEAELAVVIGRKAKNVPEARAFDYVAGYMNGNDLSARDFGARDKIPDSSPFKHDWVAHKCFDGSCPMGPYLVPAQEIVNAQDLAIELDVNGVNKQKSNTSDMIFTIAEQIADLSAKLTLWPGDIIMTGTPAGVGNGRGEYLKAGDVVKVRIAGLGELVTTMA